MGEKKKVHSVCFERMSNMCKDFFDNRIPAALSPVKAKNPIMTALDVASKGHMTITVVAADKKPTTNEVQVQVRVQVPSNIILPFAEDKKLIGNTLVKIEKTGPPLLIHSNDVYTVFSGLNGLTTNE